MSDHNSYRKTDARKEETPHHSRLFIVCSKKLTKSELEEAFDPFGKIEHIIMPRDRLTGNSKGIVYIKYSKTSEAAHAMKEMSAKPMGSENKPLKVMVASSREDENDVTEEHCKRLFIMSKSKTESELREYFQQFGTVESVFLPKKRNANEPTGFAYIGFRTFLDAAKAYEECDEMYKAVFAKPRDSLKRSQPFDNSYNEYPKNMRSVSRDSYDNRHAPFPMPPPYHPHPPHPHPPHPHLPHPPHPHAPHPHHPVDIWNQNWPNPTQEGYNYNSVKVKFSPKLKQNHIEKLFNIIPGMQSCQCTLEGNVVTGVVTYDNHNSAAHAVQKLHMFEYPLGEHLHVTPDNKLLSKVANDLSEMVQNFKDAMDSGNGVTDLKHLATIMSQASSLLKSAAPDMQIEQDPSFCNVMLPPPQPVCSGKNVPTLKRCFFRMGQPLALDLLYDIFCRFGSLITIYILPHRHSGFIKYASVEAADRAIKTLDGALVTGVLLHVQAAEDKKSEKNDSNSMEE